MSFIGGEKTRMAKFVLVGLLNTGVDFAVFVLLVYGLGAASLPAQFASYACGVGNSYFLNRKWTFRAAGRAGWGEALRFVLVNGCSFAAATLALLALQQSLGWPAYAAKAVSVFFSTAVNYAGSRYWVFRMKNAGRRAE